MAAWPFPEPEADSPASCAGDDGSLGVHGSRRDLSRTSARCLNPGGKRPIGKDHSMMWSNGTNDQDAPITPPCL